jgi:hypothetical protein
VQVLATTVEGLINQFFDDLERYHGARLVHNTVGLLCAANGGAGAAARVWCCVDVSRDA